MGVKKNSKNDFIYHIIYYKQILTDPLFLFIDIVRFSFLDAFFLLLLLFQCLQISPNLLRQVMTAFLKVTLDFAGLKRVNISYELENRSKITIYKKTENEVASITVISTSRCVQAPTVVSSIAFARSDSRYSLATSHSSTFIPSYVIKIVLQNVINIETVKKNSEECFQ